MVTTARRTQHDVTEDLVLSHLDVADSDTKAENLLQLELDGRADLSELVAQVLSVRDGGGELAGWGKSRISLVSTRATAFDAPFDRPGPRRRGICLMRASEARKASYFLASFLTSFLFLLSLAISGQHPLSRI